MRPSSLVILGFLLLSAPALAADVYSFSIDRTGGGNDLLPAGHFVLDPGRAAGTAILDGRKYRLEFAPDPESVRPYDAVISNDGEHETALGLKDHTYFEARGPKTTSPLFALLPVPGQRSVSRVTMTQSAAPDTLSGAPVQRYEIKVSYDMALAIEIPAPPGARKSPPEMVHGQVSIDAVYWMAEGQAPVLPKLLRPGVHTGFPEVDAKLDGAIGALQGIPVKQQVTISTTGDQGAEPRTSTRTVTLQNHKKREAKASLFEIPAGFKMHEPEFSRPGLGVVPD